MTRLTLTLLLLLLSLGASAAPLPLPDDPEEPRAQQVASAWFDALMSGQVAVAAGLSAVPFVFDGTRLIRSRVELTALYEQVVAEKGSREPPPNTCSVLERKSEIGGSCVPVAYVIVRLQVEDEAIDVCIRAADEPRVVGFRD